MNIGFDSLSAKESPLSQGASQSPKALFNSIKRLICSSKEVFDSVYNELLPRFQQLFPSLDSFRQLSHKQDTDRQTLQNGIESCQEEISQTAEEFSKALSNFVELENFTIRRWDENYTELWASLDPEQSSHLLPIAFSSARCIPQGTVNGSTLSLTEGLGSIYIFGKEIR